MKKFLLSASVLGVALVNAQSGMHVASGGKVHVQPNTLVYSKGGLNVAAQDGTVVSDGHIQLDGSFTNSGDGTNVQFLYTDAGAGEATAYGQLILKNDAVSTGKIFMETPVIKNQSGAGVEIAFPFVAGESILEVINSASSVAYDETTGVTTLTPLGNDIKVVTNYYRSPVYYQKNVTHEVEPEGATLRSPETLYSLYMTQAGYATAFTAITAPNATSEDKINVAFRGIPYTENFPVPQTKQVLGIDGETTFESVKDFATNRERRNSRRHHYYTYLEDFIDANTQETWGHNIYGYGNPYTSNISLTQLFADSSITADDIEGIAILAAETDNDFSIGAGTTSGKFFRATCTGTGTVDSNNCTGDLVEATDFVLRPFGTFWVKFVSNPIEGNEVKTLQFSDAIKTFGYEGLIVPGGTKYGFSSDKNTSARSSRVANGSVKASTKVASESNSNSLEVLRLAIGQEDKQIDNVFIAANPWSEEEFDSKLDAYKESTASLVVLNEDVTASNKTLHINGINMNDYVGKPINLAVNTKAGNQYSFKADVRIGGATNLDNTNFFLEDKQAKRIVRVGSDFNYSYLASDNDDNRFTVYYKETPVDVDEEVISKITRGEMDVAKDASGETYVVFRGMTGKAKVMVYNILGQLVYVDDDVSTNANYSLNKLPNNSGVYIVKVMDDKGNVISKKIVK